MTSLRHVILILSVVGLTACAGATSTTSGGPPGMTPQGELVVSAAASLTDAFSELEAAFETDNPGVDVVLNLGASSSLSRQILDGAPVDVFTSADTTNMDEVVESGQASGEPQIFARNRMQVAVPAGNPAGVTGLDDLADPDLLIGLCARQVPCGAFGRAVLDNAGVIASVDSNEPDVRALLTKIEAGELDAGITYVTDVLSTEGGVEGIEIPEDVNVDAEYPVVTLTGAPNPDAATEFVAFVLSDRGQAILNGYGFSSP